METVLELQATLNSKGKSHAASLIKSGDVKVSRSWSGPSAGAENSYLENHSWTDYGSWFLGVDNEADPETKGHYKYPFSDDFKTVSVNGLRAIRGRAAQTDEQEIFDAAGPLLDAAKEKVELGSGVGLVKFRAQSQAAQTFRAVDYEGGRMADVSILEEGEAKGHNVLITRETLEGAAKALQGKSLPAYITHANAQGDRLNTEVGYFTGFYLDGGCEHAPYGPEWCSDRSQTDISPDAGVTPDTPAGKKAAEAAAAAERAAKRRRAAARAAKGLKPTGPKRTYPLSRLKARTFQTFNSFRKYQPEAYDRLFEMAEMLPENFGVSLVFEARLFWAMDDGTQMEFEGWDDAPENSIYELPTVEVVRVMSADFVDNPAANTSLFSIKTNNGENMEIELTTAASEVLERQKKAAGEMAEKPEPQVEAVEEKPVKKKRKKIEAEAPKEILEGDDILNEMDIDQKDEESEVIEALEVRLGERDQLITDMATTMETLKAKVEALEGLMAGEEALPEDAASEEIVVLDKQVLKAQALAEVMELNQGMTKSCALLEVGKRHPEYFNN